jgi:hypothetical protein
MAITEGRKGAVYLDDGTSVLVAAMSEWTLTSNADRLDVTAFGDTDKAYLAGFKDSELRFSGFYDPADDAQADLHDAFVEGDEVTVHLYIDSAGGNGFTADGVVLGREVSTSVGGAATCNFTIAVNGAVTPFESTPS